jgi:hypothetical protein
VGEQKIPKKSFAVLDAGQDAFFANAHESAESDVLVLQGRPIGESVAQQGPFVMNTMDEIKQAYADYSKTRFGGWPWKDDAMVFERSKERFALQNGVETFPTSQR